MLVGDAVDRLVAERGWDEMVRDAEVVTRFNDVVGPDIATHATVASFDDACLVIQAVDAAWATQLRLLTVHLLASFAKAFGEGIVERIEIRGPAPPRRGRRRYRVSR
jgi:predicted nucleic acid-binding Zn ribbon protein